MFIPRHFAIPIHGTCVERPRNGYQYYREFEIRVKTNYDGDSMVTVRTRQYGERHWLKGLFWTKHYTEWDTWTVIRFEGWLQVYG
jgi:hypothetical protein